MAIRKLSLKTTTEHRGKRLDQVLADWLPTEVGEPISKSSARKLIVAGAVYLNGKRVRIASKELLLNARVEVYFDASKLNAPTATRRSFSIGESDVLFEDEWILVLNKPAGLPTQPTLDEARDNLFALTKKFLAIRTGEVQPYVGLHHRLDRDTSGVVLFTKKIEANAGVAELFSAHLAQKTYVALSAKPRGSAPPKIWTVKNYLGSVGRDGKRKKMGAVRSGGDLAQTDFTLLETLSRALYIEARPRTGRTHQIRVHLSEEGMPILGDVQYGAPESPQVPRIMLHAACLTFPHPIHKTEISVKAPIPEDFSQCLASLRASSRQ